VRVSARLFVYLIMTNCDHRGGNVNIRIGAWNGRVRSAGFARR
jgi:hypothetical protein